MSLAISTLPTFALAGQCTAESAPRRVPLLELYTSEGCDSCPPADRWISELPGRGFAPGRMVTLAFHVDYWNYLGWRDPFSKAQYSERQRAASTRNQARIVYTPQLLLNGKPYRRATIFDDLGEHVAKIAREPAPAKISLQLWKVDTHDLQLAGTAVVADLSSRNGAQAYLALYENNLFNEVSAGENRGKRLRHDFVVRELAGPFPLNAQGEAALDWRFKLAPKWKTADLQVVAFVQNERSGDVLQALAAPYCP